MNIWLFIAFNACAMLWFAIGAIFGLWAYYHGLKQIDPIPQLSNPLAGVIRKFKSRERTIPTNGDGEPRPLPSAVTRA